jgi:hypothetical protein
MRQIISVLGARGAMAMAIAAALGNHVPAYERELRAAPPGRRSARQRYIASVYEPKVPTSPLDHERLDRARRKRELRAEKLARIAAAGGIA